MKNSQKEYVYEDVEKKKAGRQLTITIGKPSKKDIEETPTFGSKLDKDYIFGTAKMEGGVKILLNIDKVSSGHGLDLAKKVV